MSIFTVDKPEIEDQENEISSHDAKNMDNIMSLVNMAINLKQTYRTATKQEKRNYINLFFDKFIVKEGKLKQ